MTSGCYLQLQSNNRPAATVAYAAVAANVDADVSV